MRSCPRWALLALLVVGSVVRAADTPLPQGFRPLAALPDAQWDLRLQVAGEQPAVLLFAVQDATHGYRLRLSAELAVLERLNGEAAELGRAARPLVGTGQHQVLLRRRESALHLVIDGRLLLTVLDGTYGAGAAAVSAEAMPRVKVVENGYQAVEDIYFTDDFMRTKDQQQLGVWRHLAGKWRFYSVLETNERADLKLSVNPFSLGLDCEGDQPAAVVTGHPFWADYRYGASVRCRGGAWAGLIFSQRADNDYFLLRADLRERPLRARRIELVRVTGTTETVLDGGTTLLTADQWYRLGVVLRGSRVKCLLDEDVIFDRVEPEAVGGPIGLWSRGAGSETLFDDIRCETNYDQPFERVAELNGPAVERVGDWRLEPVEGARVANDPGPRRLVTSATELGQYVFGDPAAQSYRLDARVFAKAAGKVSLLFGWRNRRNYWYAEWDSDQGRLSLGQVADGVTKPVGYVRDRLDPQQDHRIAVDLLTPGRVLLRRDGMLRMRASVADLPAGRLGVAVSGTPAIFGELLQRGVVPVDTEVEVDNANFAGDPFMLHWASSLADWFPKGDPAVEANKQQIYWHKGDFYRAYHLEVPLKASTALLLNATEEKWLPPADAVVTGNITRIDEVADKQFGGDGYALHVVPQPTGANLFLFRRGELVKEATVPAGVESLTVAHDGGVTWVDAAGQDVLVYHDHQPLTGPRVALRVAGNDVLYNVKCRREGIIDEVFEKAPATWVEQGNWEITNRFSCTPTWSHMTALERQGLGALWHKAAFPGNVTIEYYAGMRMQSDFAMIYPRPGDFNVSFACRPFSLESGISLLPGAWDAAWSSTRTRYAQGDRVIAETDRPLVPRTREDSGQRYIPVPYISAGRDVHGAWYYVRSRYVDGRLEGSFDNVQVLNSEAPAVDGDRVAVWTQDNQIVIARVRITYLSKTIPKRLIDQDATPATPAWPAPTMVTTAAVGGLACGFDDSLDGWTVRDAFRGVSLEQGEENGRRYLVARNALPGDSFEAVLPLGDKKLGQLESLALTPAAVLRFDYKLPPETKINAYLTLNGQRWVIPLTGQQEDSPVTPVLVRPQQVIADGKWQTCRLPLGAALRRAFGKAAVTLTDFRFGNLQEGYLLAGFGGNPRGSWYAIDNFAIVPEAAAGQALKPSLVVLPKAGQAAPSLKAVRLAVDRQPRTVPTEAPAGGDLPAPAESGVWYLHAQGQLEDGTLTAASHLPVLVVADAPQLRLVGGDAPWDGGPLRLAFDDSAPTDVQAAIADKPLTWEQAVTVDAERSELVLDPRAARLTFTEGQVVPLKVAAAFRTGGRSELSFTKVYSRAADTTPPLPPTVTGAGVLLSASRGAAPFAASQPNQTAVSIDPAESPEPGGRSFKVTNLVPSGSLGVSLLSDDADVGRAPLLMFDYKIAPPVRTDFVVYMPGEYYSLGFTDQSGVYPALANVPEVQRDGQWHRASLNLQQALLSTSPYAPNLYLLRRLMAADYGYSGAAPGASWWLENVRLVQTVSGRAGFRLSWQAFDPGGLSKWRIGLSTDEAAAPATELPPETTSQTFNATQDGLTWFAVQACDAAGNWSGVTRVPVLVDNTPPVFGTPTPAPGALGTWDLTLPVSGVELAGLDPQSLRLTAGAKTVAVSEGDIAYDAAKQTMRWSWAWATKQFGGRVADGTPLKVAVTGKDLAGNEAQPASWEYKISYAADQQPPVAPALTVPKQPVHKVETCTSGLGQLGYMASGYRSRRTVFLDPERRDYVCRVTTGGSGVPLSYGQVDLLKTPFLSFDYKLSSGVVAHLLVYVNGTYYSVALNGKSRSYRQIGQVPVVADGKWHTILVDLLAMARPVIGQADKVTCNYIQLEEQGSGSGLAYWLDHVAVFGPVPPGPLAAQWWNYDATGIQAAAVSLTPGLEAPEPTQAKADLTTQTTTLDKPGTYLLQVRSQDGAGHLGGSTRRVVVVR